MKMKETIRVVPQPQPFTPGLTKAMIREHIQRLCERCLLDHAPRTLEDWVLVERDLIEELQGKFS